MSAEYEHALSERRALRTQLSRQLPPGLRESTRTRLSELTSQLAEHERRRDAFAELPAMWQALYGEVPGFLSLFTGRRSKPGERLTDVQERFYAWPREVRSAIATVDRESEAEREVYSCAHLLTRWRRREQDAAPVLSLWVDLDKAPGSPEIPPTVEIESSPGHAHLYYRLSHPIAPPEAADLNRRLARVLGGDAGGWDVTQLLRVPGTRNHRYAERPEVRLIRLDTEQVYDPDALSRDLPQVQDVARRERPRTWVIPAIGGEGPVPLTKAGMRVWRGIDFKRRPDGGVDRSASLVRLARLLHHARLSRELIVALLAQRDASLGWRKYSDRADAAEQYNRIVDVVEKTAATKPRRRG